VEIIWRQIGVRVTPEIGKTNVSGRIGDKPDRNFRELQGRVEPEWRQNGDNVMAVRLGV
jgi:hypothetical protein